jgi:predicted O-methyltransferase YrrM
MQETWDAVDAFIERELVEQDDALRTAAGGIAVSPAQGKFLHLLAVTIGARRVLELGTLHGYSAIWLARSGAEVVTLELDPGNASRARANVDAAGVGEGVDIRVGPAIESLRDVDGPFDLAFIDADKAGMPDYFAAILPLMRPGGLIIGDNTVRGGRILEPADDNTVRGGRILEPADDNSAGARRFHEVVGAEPRVDATALQTVGVKGYDGFVLARVR